MADGSRNSEPASMLSSSNPGVGSGSGSLFGVQVPPMRAGSIRLVIGPMFARKSSELLRAVRNEQDRGRRVVLVKSAVDTRYTPGHICTHDGDMLPCTVVNSLLPLLSSAEFMGNDVIAVDEAQFFPDLFDFVVSASETHAKDVIVASLDGDFKRERFGQVLDLVPKADSVIKLSGVCRTCLSKSLFTIRNGADQRQELVGGEDTYVPVCRQCYVFFNTPAIFTRDQL